MCTVCGCGSTGTVENEHVHTHEQTGDLHYGMGQAGVSLPHVSQARTIKLEQDVLSANNHIAQHNREHFISHGVLAYNLVSSPGSGKTTLLCATINRLKADKPDVVVSVIEGDQQTTNDADRIRATGAPAIQVNTGKGCHLDAQMVSRAFNALHEKQFNHAHEHGQTHAHAHSHEHTHDHSHSHQHADGHDHTDGHSHEHSHDHVHEQMHDHHHHDLHAASQASSLLFIENVGNLVCPAMWDLGEKAKVAILSVTEGEDKPLKYPDMFAAASVMILNKIDLLPYLNFDVERCIAYAKQVNPTIEVLKVSATSGEGMDDWIKWLYQSNA